MMKKMFTVLLIMVLMPIIPVHGQSRMVIRLDNYAALNKAYYAFKAKKRKKLRLREYDPQVTKLLENGQKKKVKGFKYSAKTNTLTITKVNKPALKLNIYNADDFLKIKIVGKVHLRNIEMAGKRSVLSFSGKKGTLILSDHKQVFTDPHEALMTFNNFNHISIASSLKVKMTRMKVSPLLSYSYVGKKNAQILAFKSMTKTKKSFVDEAPMMSVIHQGKALTING